ncbi:unnamed protein product [Camellia sinensis]
MNPAVPKLDQKTHRKATRVSHAPTDAVSGGHALSRARSASHALPRAIAHVSATLSMRAARPAEPCCFQRRLVWFGNWV